MIYEYSIPTVPPSLNKFAGRKNEWAYRAQKQEMESLVYAYCRPTPPEPIEKAVVTLTFHFKTRQRHDPDNYAGGSKPILDGLVKSGIILDDSFDCIDLCVKQGEPDKNGRTDICVEEV